MKKKNYLREINKWRWARMQWNKQLESACCSKIEILNRSSPHYQPNSSKCTSLNSKACCAHLSYWAWFLGQEIGFSPFLAHTYIFLGPIKILSSIKFGSGIHAACIQVFFFCFWKIEFKYLVQKIKFLISKKIE